ncbi:MAG: hypothetical protein N3C60_02875 [Calditerrivibrio sp.]|nr:hypothetical protein [Calditerrivibrio sp.]
MLKKDISFLEHEYLQFLLMNYFIGENNIEINNDTYTYIPKGRITLYSESDFEKIDIESISLYSCKEMYVSLKNAKAIKQLSLSLTGKNFTIDFVLKTSPLRLTSINAPKSLGEDIEDKVIERILYLNIVESFYEKTLKGFLEARVSDNWNFLLKNFNDYLSAID